jgi:hypothetical protein
MKRYLLIGVFLFWTILVYAQADDPGMPGGDPDVPVDGGIALLLLAGAAYGAKKIKEAARKNQEP